MLGLGSLPADCFGEDSERFSTSVEKVCITTNELGKHTDSLSVKRYARQRIGALSPRVLEENMANNTSAHTGAELKGSWFSNQSVRTKILAIAIVGALTSVIIALVGLVSLLTQQSTAESTEREITATKFEAQEMERSFWEARIQVARASATSPVATNQQAFDQFQISYDQALAEADTLWGHFNSEYQGTLMANLDGYYSLVVGEFKSQLLAGSLENSEKIRSEQITPAANQLFETLELINAEVAQYGADITADTASAAQRSIIILMVVAVAGSALALVLGIVISRAIVTNVQEVQNKLVELAENDLTTDADVHTNDETGQMARLLNVAQASLRTILHSVTETADESVHESEVLAAASAQLAAALNETSAQAGVVAAAAEQVSTNVQTVAAGSEQMSASIREIAQNAQEATSVARTAATTAEATNVTVSRLGDSSREIGDVIKTITSIAEQTNLLALNATIEAARAGEAGKGFAVVASEVKELAAESARAAEDVARRVEAIQSDTSSAVSAIAQIGEIIGTINNYQMTIASAVEEQTATTNEMSRSAAEAATGSSQIAANINSVATVVEESTAAINSMDQTIAKVSSSANNLSERVHVFKF